MRSQIKIPDKTYFKKAYQILMNGDINLSKNNYTYYSLNEKIFTSEELKILLESNGLIERLKISSGTSDRFAFNGFIKQAQDDLEKGAYYRFYSPPKGNIIIRKSLSYMENLKLNDNTYTEEDFCMTEGSTGGITMIFEYLKRDNPNNEIIIASPAYYLYKFSAKYYKLKYTEIVSKNPNSPFSLDIDQLKTSITPQTKLIVLTNPNNPVGEIYSSKKLEEILNIAKKKKILVLVDEIFFDLIFNKESAYESDIIAKKNDALSQLIIVKGYSKNKNLAAFRIGYVFSKNQRLINELARIAEQRQCFASAQNYVGVICMDAFIQSVDMLTRENLNIYKNITTARKSLMFSSAIAEKSYRELKKIFVDYQSYFAKKMKFYSDSYDIALDILKDEIEIATPKQTAFNTLIKIKGLEKINYFDFCFNLFLTTGIESQIGPCFAFNQKKWQNDPSLGFWLRITFARDQKMFIKSLRTFMQFKKIYLKNQNKFLQTNKYF